MRSILLAIITIALIVYSTTIIGCRTTDSTSGIKKEAGSTQSFGPHKVKRGADAKQDDVIDIGGGGEGGGGGGEGGGGDD